MAAKQNDYDAATRAILHGGAAFETARPPYTHMNKHVTKQRDVRAQVVELHSRNNGKKD